MTSIRPVILSGGSGTRLWPLSRSTFPKQLLPISSSERTMLQETAGRLAGADFLHPLVIGGEEHRFFLKRQLEQARIPVEAILLEPTGRNTAAAAALAALWALERDEDEFILLLPSDHVVGDPDALVDAVHAGLAAAERGGIVTFGERPRGPSTEFGYIEADTAVDGGAHAVRQFCEKPERATAEEFVRSGRFFWNSGMFLFRASTLRDELAALLPETLNAAEKAVRGMKKDGIFLRPDAEAFKTAPDVSLDYGIMEKTRRAFVVPVELGWSDVGSWGAVWQLADKDDAGNALSGDVVAHDVRNSLIRSEGSATVAAIGLERMAVVAVRDAVFVAPIERAAEVRQLVDQLRQEEREIVTLPSRVERPWGSYETKDRGARYQNKHIVVGPGEQLSLQMHYHRSEHWIVVSGTAEVTVGDKVTLLQENQSTYIPAGTNHRLANPGKVPLELVEVQCGSYLGEDDIVRFDDRYGRA